MRVRMSPRASARGLEGRAALRGSRCRAATRPGVSLTLGVTVAVTFLLATPLLAQTRIASDFELQQMEKQIAQQRGFLAQLSGHLNLGDLRLARNETVLATAEFTKALDVAQRERTESRKSSDLTRYAEATSYAALAEAKLAHDARAFDLAEESLRYASDSARTWNLYANTMTALHRPRKAVSAERNAVALASEPLDLAIYRYALASSLIELGERAEAKQLLVEVVASLKSKSFDALRANVAKQESFEIYSSVRGDASAYVSLVNRSQLRLAALYESEGDLASARATYRDVLTARTDDPTALSALARLATNGEERTKYFAEAFDANPFSLPLIRDYERVAAQTPPPGRPTVGDKVQSAVYDVTRGELHSARTTLDALIAQFPDNDTLRVLRREAEGTTDLPAFMTNAPKSVVRPTTAELRQLVIAKNLDRAVLDALTFQSTVTFASSTIASGQTIFENGDIDGVRFRFDQPIAFNGTFAAHMPLRLTYRILGQTDGGLLLEPIQLQEVK